MYVWFESRVSIVGELLARGRRSDSELNSFICEDFGVGSQWEMEKGMVYVGVCLGRLCSGNNGIVGRRTAVLL